MNMKTILLLTSATLGVAVAAVLAGRAVAARRLRQDVRELFAGSTNVAGRTYHESQLTELPAPVQRYFRRVLREGQPYLRGVRLRHTGQFKTDLDKDWVDIEGEQYLTADPPGFIWQGTTRQFTARDEYVAGRGGLTVLLLGAVPVVHGTGPQYDQGEMLRWLGESAWQPTALLPNEHLRWTAVNDLAARLEFTHGEHTVHYLVRFNAHDEITECEALRYQGETRLLPWRGRFSEYRELHGVLVPTRIEGLWVMDGQERPYARFTVQELQYALLEPY